MIGLTRTNGDPCRLNPAEIQRVETHPCTLVYLSDGTKYAVAEDIDELARRVRECRARGVAAGYRVGEPAAAAAEPPGCTVPAAVVVLRSRRER